MRGGPFSEGPLDVDEAALLDAQQQRVHRALDELGETLLTKARRDLVPVCRPFGQDCEHDALERALEHLGHLIRHADSLTTR